VTDIWLLLSCGHADRSFGSNETHGSTFSNNELAMAAGIATLDVLQSERLIEDAARTGERLLNAFAEKIPGPRIFA
jgi:acetylornithine/succinyldiaminopimelate/putrescine aminotransferase